MVDGIITQGSTPWQGFNLPDCFNNRIKKATITFAQRGRTPLIKISDFVIEGDKLSPANKEFCYDYEEAKIWVQLSEWDTLYFGADYPVEAQLKILTNDNEVFLTSIYTLRVQKALDIFPITPIGGSGNG